MFGSRRTPLLLTAALATALAAVLAGCAGGASPSQDSDSASGDDLATVTLAQVGKPAMIWPIYVAEERGLFSAHGVNVETVVAQSAGAAVQAVVAGSADVGSSGIPDIVNAATRGGGISIVTSGIAQAPDTFLAPDDVTDWSDLKGETVILGAQKDITTYFFEILAEENGLDPDDVNATYAGSTAARYSALESGSVSLADVTPPITQQGLANGYVSLGSAADVLPDTPYTGLLANDDWIASEPEAAEGFVSAYIEATTWLRAPENEDEAVDILVDATGTTDDLAKATYDVFVGGGVDYFAPDGQMNVDDLQALLDGLSDSGFLEVDPKPAQEYVDSSIAEKAVEDDPSIVE